MSTSVKYPLIGIAGTFASGKDTVANHLEKDFAYNHSSLGDIIREVAMKERGSIERHILHEVGLRLRREGGPGVLTEIAMEKPRPLVISGFRSLGEAKTLKKHEGLLLFVDAPLEIRYERMRSRQRDAETQLTLEEFREREEKEWYGGDTDADFNLRDIKKMSDIVIENSTDLGSFLAELYQRLELK